MQSEDLPDGRVINSAEMTQLNHGCLARGDTGKLIECFVKSKDVICGDGGGNRLAGFLPIPIAGTSRCPGAGVINEHVADDAGCEGKDARVLGGMETGHTGEAEIRLMDEGSRRKAVSGTLMSRELAGDLAELLIEFGRDDGG